MCVCARAGAVDNGGVWAQRAGAEQVTRAWGAGRKRATRGWLARERRLLAPLWQHACEYV